MKKLILLTFFILTFFSTISQAQTFELGEFGAVIGIGGNTYVGDLNPDRNTRQFNMQVAFNRYVDDRVFFKWGINYGYIQGEFEPGDDINLGINPEVNRYFSAKVLSTDLSFNWEVIQWSFIHVYTGAGIGFMDYSIEDSEGRNLNSRPGTRITNEEYDTRLAYFPINLGFVLFPQRQINLIFEQSWNLTNSDYLDNIGYIGDSSSDWILRRMFLVRYKF